MRLSLLWVMDARDHRVQIVLLVLISAHVLLVNSLLMISHKPFQFLLLMLLIDLVS